MNDASLRQAREGVVVTGMGAITPLGLSVDETWDAAVRGVSGAATITRFDVSQFTTHFGCEVKGFDPRNYMDRKLSNRLDPYSQYALAAANEALRDAGLDSSQLTQSARERIGVIVGSGIGGIRTFEEQSLAYHRNGAKRLSPFFIPMMLPNMAAGVISMRHGFHGPNHAIVTACATGNHNLLAGLKAICDGEADIVLAGGTDAAICELGLGGFGAIKALSTRNDAPQAASRPFDAERDGFVMGDGAGVLVLESRRHAEARGARIHAELLGVGESSDAHHMTAPHPEGLGARLAMTRALASAGIAPADVDTINMHGTSTPPGDAAESRAVRAVFGEHADAIAATSTKGMTGHLLGAAGAVEAIFSILSITHGIVPPTINRSTLDPACDLAYVFNQSLRREIRVAISNAFGFGGHNTTAVFRAA